jgi:hypothetical protein
MASDDGADEIAKRVRVSNVSFFRFDSSNFNSSRESLLGSKHFGEGKPGSDERKSCC